MKTVTVIVEKPSFDAFIKSHFVVIPGLLYACHILIASDF